VTPARADSTGPGRISGQRGDLVLRDANGATLTFATSRDLDAHRPVRGAIVDLQPSGDAVADPVAWWRVAWFDAAGVAHPLVAQEVVSIRCTGGAAGVRVSGIVDAVRLERTVCAAPHGGFTIETLARSPLPRGGSLGDEIDAGTAQISVDRMGPRFGHVASTPFVALVEHGFSAVLAASSLTLERNDLPTNDELTQRIVFARYGSRDRAESTLTLVRGDVFDALDAVANRTWRTISLRGPRGEFDLLDANGDALATGTMPGAGTRTIRVPPAFGASVLFRDERGVPAARAVPLAPTVIAPRIDRALVRLAYTDGNGRPLTVHVLFRGIDATRDPTPILFGRGAHAGRSVYLLDGRGEVALAPGRYRVTATHGLRHALDVRTIQLAADDALDLEGRLAEVVPAAGYIAADFHLHAAPSPDSRVSLADRVTALACEGIDLAVATDHNHVTDYAPFIASLGLDDVLAAIPGSEVTTFAPHWGHFNVFPLAAGNARSEAIIPFFGTTPARIFADARARHARIVQVNHPRMLPSMGYFERTHFDPSRGVGDANYATGFDAIEVFNGWNIEHPEITRGVLHDLVALARAGQRPAATGNSDSHYLLYEEAGYPRTYVQTPRDPVGDRAERVMQALLRGATTVSSGPLVEADVDGRGPGSLVNASATGRVRLHVRVSAPAWVPVDRVQVWLDDDVVQEARITDDPVDGVRFDREFDLPLDRDAVLVVWVDAETPLPDVLPYPRAMPLGFSGLIGVDRDGDGVLRLASSERALVP
jgi:hypothetical protein